MLTNSNCHSMTWQRLPCTHCDITTFFSSKTLDTKCNHFETKHQHNLKRFLLFHKYNQCFLNKFWDSGIVCSAAMLQMICSADMMTSVTDFLTKVDHVNDTAQPTKSWSDVKAQLQLLDFLVLYSYCSPDLFCSLHLWSLPSKCVG